jgi:uncharacterized OB-fold protein
VSDEVAGEAVFAMDAQGPYLIGGRRSGDGEVVFPYPGDGSGYERVNLARRGTLWSYTVQRFCPKPPFVGADSTDFEPYAVGYVELEDVIVETRIHTGDFESLRLGEDMRLVIEEIRSDAPGAGLRTFAFQPIRAGART